MEAPQKGLSDVAVAQAFTDYIEKHYTKVDEKKFICKECETQIENTTCYISIHDKASRGCTGSGEVKPVPLPYCPKCEGLPTNKTTCMHV